MRTLSRVRVVSAPVRVVCVSVRRQADVGAGGWLECVWSPLVSSRLRSGTSSQRAAVEPSQPHTDQKKRGMHVHEHRRVRSDSSSRDVITMTSRFFPSSGIALSALRVCRRDGVR